MCPNPPASPHLRQPWRFLSTTQLHCPSRACLLALCPMAFARVPLPSCMVNHVQSFRRELMCCFFRECPFRCLGKSLWVYVAFFPSISLSLPLLPRWCENTHWTFSSVRMETTSILLTAASMWKVLSEYLLNEWLGVGRQSLSLEGNVKVGLQFFLILFLKERKHL